MRLTILLRMLGGVSALAALAVVAPSTVSAQPQPGAAPFPTPPERAWELALSGPGSTIGVSIRDVEASESERLKTTGGALIEDVRGDSPAEKAGLKKGDVVVEFDGEHVRSARQLARLVGDTPPGRTVKASVLRDGRRTDLSVTPSGDRRVDTFINRDQLHAFTDRFPGDFNFDIDLDFPGARARLGVSVQELPEQLAQYFGTKGGVLVASVTADSPAAKAGLKAGDVITTVGGKTVGTRGDLVRALRDLGDSETTIGIVREKHETTVTAKIETARKPGRTARVRPA